MSQDFYLACHECKKVIQICSHGFSGFSFYSGEPDCMAKLRDFLEHHTFNTSHALQVVPEQGHEYDSYEHIEWEAKG